VATLHLFDPDYLFNTLLYFTIKRLFSLKITMTSSLIAAALLGASFSASAADKGLLDILLENGAINQTQHEELMKKPSLTSQDFVASTAPSEAEVEKIVDRKVSEAVAKTVSEFPVKVSQGKKGFRLESKDGKFQTNLQWRAQMRATTPMRSDPRQFDDFDDVGDNRQNTFEARRVRMKIGGHAFQPWLGYYFEVDLQPTRSRDKDAASASSRLIDWRITVDKYKALGFRLGQWKIDYNRERVDSSGRQQFVERSIANRVFTIDRQVGAQLRGHLFEGTGADMKYYAGAFTGEGRGVSNDDEDLMYAGRLQWNFLGRDLKLRQTDVEFTEKPTGSLSVAAMTNTGACTRWSSSGCGSLDGFGGASNGQYKVDQWTQGAAFKWRGFSFQQEFHNKTVEDTLTNISSDLTGGYVQSGYFFHHLFSAIPKELEFAARYASVKEPNETNIQDENHREEFTLGANWFMSGHNNKVTADYSYLTLDDGLRNEEYSDGRFRVQWDISF